MNKILNNQPLLLALILIIAFFVLTAFAMGSKSSKEDYRAEESTEFLSTEKIYLDESVDGDYFGGLLEELTVETTIAGDLNSFLVQDLNINGNVKDVNAFLVEFVSITEDANDVHVLADTLEISSRVNGNVYFLGGNLYIPEGAVVTGNVYAVAESIKIEGTVLGKLVPLVDEENLEVSDNVTVDSPIFLEELASLKEEKKYDDSHKSNNVLEVILTLISLAMFGLLLWFITRGKKLMKNRHYGYDFLFGFLTVVLFVPFAILVTFFLGAWLLGIVIVMFLGLLAVSIPLMYVAISEYLVDRKVIKDWSYQHYVLVPVLIYILLEIPVIGVLVFILLVVIFHMVIGNLIKRIFG